MSHVRVEGLTKIFGDRPERARRLLEEGRSKDQILEETGQVVAVDDVTFDVDRGELFVVMGLSGSGKSTVIRMLNRLIEPTAGSVRVDGDEVTTMDEDALRRLRQEKISMVFQHFALFPHRTVRENAAYGLRIKGASDADRREKAEWALERVGLGGWGDSYPHELSGGMQQRVGLARALATEADILLMDEPFSALDPLIRRDMQDLLLELQEELQRTIVFITHDLNEAMRIGDRIVVMKDGGVVQIGTGAEIIHDPADDYVAEFVADVDRSRVLTADLAMRAPKRTFAPTATPDEVLRYLDDAEVNGVYVVADGKGRDGKVLGVARDDRIVKAKKAGAGSIRDHLVDAYATARRDTLLSDLAPIAAQHAVPIAVIDDDGRLEGVVTRARLLAALAGDDHTTDAPAPAHDQEDALVNA